MAVNPQLQSIEVGRDTIILAPGGVARLSAWGRDQRGRPFSFTPVWSATGGTLDTANIYTAGTQPGDFGATVRDAHSGQTAFVAILIDAGAPVIRQVFVKPSRITLGVGTSAELNVLTLDQFGNLHQFTPQWTVTGGTMSGNTYNAGGATGTFSAQISDGAGHTAQCVIVIVPAGFTLVSPPDNAMDQPVNLGLTWQPHPLAMAYHIQVARDAQFTDLVIDDSLTPGPSYICSLTPQAHLYWRVMVRSLRDTTIVSPSWSFTTRKTYPALVTLRSPVDGSVDQALAINPSWDTHPAFSKYRFTLALNPDMMNPVRVDSNLVAGTLSLQNLQHKTDYYWRIDATTEYGGVVSSPIWYFRTKDTTSTVVGPGPASIKDFTIFGNYPNPFSGKTIISYGLPTEADVHIDVRTLTGAVVTTYRRSGELRGMHHIEWDASRQPTGAYLVTITAVPSDGSPVRRAVLRATVVH
jgi:hypothetical protein